VKYDLTDLVDKYKKRSFEMIDLVIVGSHEDTDIDAYLDESGFYVYKEFSIYVHKSMTRTISILKRSS
jgi:tRNA G10  N-methylase Trm11